MEVQELFNILSKDFNIKDMKDDWSRMTFNDYITDTFRDTYIGLVADNTETINKVYTAVFLSTDVIKNVLKRNEKNVLIFTHHPMEWNLAGEKLFNDINIEYLRLLKEKNISIYTLHHPLDVNGEYSTGVTLAKALDYDLTEEEFFDDYNHKVGIVGKSNISTVKELKAVLENKLGHEVKLYNYGDETITDNKVAFVGGGGCRPEGIQELIDKGINVCVTGVTTKSPTLDYRNKAHELAEKYKINILGGTHYSTEKFACIKMIEYFNKIGLDAEFIKEEPCMIDM